MFRGFPFACNGFRFSWMFLYPYKTAYVSTKFFGHAQVNAYIDPTVMPDKSTGSPGAKTGTWYSASSSSCSRTGPQADPSHQAVPEAGAAFTPHAARIPPQSPEPGVCKGYSTAFCTVLQRQFLTLSNFAYTKFYGLPLEIASSDFISIMGPSGSGKSTLLHLLSGLDKPTSGSLTYDGKDIYRFNDKELSAFRRQRIGFIFQQFNLLPVLTAKENIIMPLLLDKKQPDEAYLNQLTDLLGIRERMTHLPHELSGGQQQRVAIARALIAKPDIIFADEPTGNLDSKSGGEVMEMLQSVWKKMGKTLVIITHDSRIARMADRQFVIVDGVLSEVTAR